MAHSRILILVLFLISIFSPRTQDVIAEEPSDLVSICGTGSAIKADIALPETIYLHSVIGELTNLYIASFDRRLWKTQAEAEAAVKELFHRKNIRVIESWQWVLADPVTMRGEVEFKKGVRQAFGIADHRVCFKDISGKAWFFEWPEQMR